MSTRSWAGEEPQHERPAGPTTIEILDDTVARLEAKVQRLEKENLELRAQLDGTFEGEKE